MSIWIEKEFGRWCKCNDESKGVVVSGACESGLQGSKCTL